MASNSSINLISLDFDTLKESLKDYLKSQPTFSDYDFEGSNMNVLLDILSYNTFHNAFYMNMVVNESYLDSAQLRNSVVSHAKELNYLPRSARSAKATVDLSFTANTNVVTIPKGTSFTATVGPNLLTFITDEESVQFSSNGYFLVDDLDIYEGKEASDQFIVNYENLTQRFVITDPNVDVRSVVVTVIEDNTGTSLDYTATTSTLGVNAEDQVFFIQACEDGKFEIIFGDDIIGRRPKDNAVVSVEYRVTSRAAGNGAARFSLDDGFADFTSSPVVNTVDISRGGAEAESIDSIKFYAPRFFQTQERAINTSDYEIMLKQRFPEINAVVAYGGESIDPPRYGKVFISVDISDVDGIPESREDEYTEFLRPRIPLSIETVFVEPDQLFYRVDSTVNYDTNTTTLNPEQVKSLVVNSIITYDDVNLNDFNSNFRYSKFVAAIDGVDGVTILSNDTDVTIYKRIEPSFNEIVNMDVAFSVPLTTAGSVLGTRYDASDLVAVTSSDFTYGGDSVRIEDDGSGNLRLIKTVQQDKVVALAYVGSIDYDTGFMQLTNLRVDALPLGENYIRIYGVPRIKDFSTRENVILTLEPEIMRIDVVPVREE